MTGRRITYTTRRWCGNGCLSSLTLSAKTNPMNLAPPAIRDFARRLIALEAVRDEPPGAGAVEVVEKLRLRLARLAGEAGFRSLLSRAVALANAEVSSLATVQVQAGGSLEISFGQGNEHDAAAVRLVGGAVVAQLLGLLVTFVGEPLTLQLVRDAWPEASVAGPDAESGGRV